MWLRAGFHLTALAVDVYFLSLSLNVHNIFGHLRMLTTLTHLAHTLFFVISLAISLQHLSNYKKSNGKTVPPSWVSNFFFVVWVAATMTGVLFWSIFFYDRELVFPKAFEPFYPFHLNLYQHGVVSIVMWIEMLVVFHALEVRNIFYNKQMKVLFLVCCIYDAWIYLQRVILGRWTYPFFAQLSIVGHVIFTLSVLVVVLFVASALAQSQKLWWHEIHVEINTKKKRTRIR